MRNFSGYSTEALGLLSQIGAGDKAFFASHKKAYETQIATPTKAFVSDLGAALAAGCAPGIVAVPRANGSIAPINNDLRFAPDRPPYKDNLLLRFWRGSDKKLAPTLFVRIRERDVGFACGVGLDSVGLAAWREAVASDAGAELADLLKRLGQGRELETVGQELKRVPKPYANEHPRANLLKHKSLQARWLEPVPDEIHSAAFVPYCASQLKLAVGVLDWLSNHVVVPPETD
ncbi:MAG: DUF2461 domain-containing protein [Actinomycetia bacterium]|nr:DUF2461 domain-containing protein [Actinomycetes bacterium]